MEAKELKAIAFEFMETYGESKVLLTADGQTFLPSHRHDAENHIRAERLVPPVVFEFEKEPGHKLQEPSSKSQEPGDELQEPGSKSKEPGDKLQEPGSKSQVPRAKFQELGRSTKNK